MIVRVSHVGDIEASPRDYNLGDVESDEELTELIAICKQKFRIQSMRVVAKVFDGDKEYKPSDLSEESKIKMNTLIEGLTEGQNE